MYTMLHDRGLFEISKHIFNRLTEYFSFKMFAGVGVTIYEFAFGHIPYNVAGAIVALVLIDMVTGIMASKRTGVLISSKRAFATAGKLAVYGLLISAGHLTEVVIGYDIRVDEGIMVILALTELISILENGANLGYSIPKKLLNQLKKMRDDK